MSLTITKPTSATGRALDYVAGNKQHCVRTVTISATPSSGGDTITAASVGLKHIEQVLCHGAFRSSAGTTAVQPNWNYATGKLQFYETAATVDLPLDEADGTPSLANFVGYITFIGDRR